MVQILHDHRIYKSLVFVHCLSVGQEIDDSKCMLQDKHRYNHTSSHINFFSHLMAHVLNLIQTCSISLRLLQLFGIPLHSVKRYCNWRCFNWFLESQGLSSKVLIELINTLYILQTLLIKLINVSILLIYIAIYQSDWYIHNLNRKTTTIKLTIISLHLFCISKKK